MARIVPKNTVITCPRKGHEIGTLNQDVVTQDLLNTRVINFESGQERLAGAKPLCEICGSQYYVQGKIHTSEGWKPEDPTLETPPMR